MLSAISLEELRACTPRFDLVPYAEAKRRGCAVLADGDGRLLAALADPFDARTQDWLEHVVREPVQYRVPDAEDLAAFFAQREEAVRAMDDIVPGAADGPLAASDAQEVSLEAIGQAENPVVRLVGSTLYDALKSGASDVHLESTGAGLAIKYRVDGVLVPVKSVPGAEVAEQAISRVKVLAELDIAERRLPQDGRLKVRSKGREIDLRVSVMPSVHGEDAVLRILDKRALADQMRELTLAQLGFDEPTVRTLRRLAAEPYGMLLVTGPTGSGKTTTLYAAISEANRGTDKMVTIEDPVEYQLPGVLQIPVNDRKGLTFARGLRSILRHDPDRIMVGEIRDSETAEIAVQAALTGHLVYTTVHANSVFDVIGRFLHMGVDTFNFVSALNAIMAQRLVRTICNDCAAEENGVRRGLGCGRCRGTGYRGRKAIAELLVMNDDFREMIVARSPARRLKEAARAAGTRTLREAALELVKAGETTLEEINRVTFVAE
ncbi:MAG: GspE/PulE family protein [Betaproteobacteria bacterium]|nr:GspE/PulE family protein [Betaproteobacteria bacterium]MDH5352590.1 GspE/PulE family protein [Betaproteobacteria bacterium]